MQQFVASRLTGPALGVLVGVGIAVFALWYCSAGNFPVFPSIQNDYVDLGDAFLHGQLSLKEQPDPQLATLSDPYDFKQRKNIPYHWDASYYNGKYYLYWGPVPGLVSSLLEGITRVLPSGPILVLIPYIGLLVVFLATLIHITGYFPSMASRLSVGLFMILGFANLPLLFTIGQPRHYQASILYGQLFLLSGLLAFAMYTRAKRGVLLVTAGLNWGLALGCRYNLAISVSIYLVFAMIWLFRTAGLTGSLERFGLLLAPLALALIGLGIYNLVRFGNPMETGLAYQLTIPELHQHDFSLAYVPSNLYSYLFYPLTRTNDFPFIQSAHFHASFLPGWLTLPNGQVFDQIILGVFSTVPALWLFALAIPFLVLLVKTAVKRQIIPSLYSQKNLLFAMISFAAAGQFLFLMVFFYVAERYIVDFYLPFILGLAIFVWQIDESMQFRQPFRLGLWLIVAGLTVWTAAVGFFGCFGVPTLVSNYYDPALYARLASYWNARHAQFQFALNSTLGIVLKLIHMP